MVAAVKSSQPFTTYYLVELDSSTADGRRQCGGGRLHDDGGTTATAKTMTVYGHRALKRSKEKSTTTTRLGPIVDCGQMIFSIF